MRATATKFVGRRSDGKRIVRAILYASVIPGVLPTTGEGIDGMSADDVFAAGSRLNVVSTSGTTRYIANDQGLFCLQSSGGGGGVDDDDVATDDEIDQMLDDVFN